MDRATIGWWNHIRSELPSNGLSDEDWIRLSKWIRFFAKRAGGGDLFEPDIDDVTQQVLLRLQKGKVRKGISRSVWPPDYLETMVQRQIIDNSRKRRATRRADRNYTVERVLRQAVNWFDVGIAGVEAYLTDDPERNELIKRVNDALWKLTDKERRLVRQFYWERHDISYLASIWGVKPNTIAARLVRARTKLKRILS